MIGYRRLNRLIKLIGFLVKYDGCSVKKLSGLLNTSVRTVYRYLKQLTNSGFPISRDLKKTYHLTKRPDLSEEQFLTKKPEILGAKAVAEFVSEMGEECKGANDLLAKLKIVNDNGFLCGMI